MEYTLKNLKKPFYKNSFFLLATSLVNTLFGFIFWLIAAKFYSVNDVGVASALIASIGLVSYLSLAGLDLSIIRFFPEMDKNRLYTTTIIIVTILTILCSIVYIFGISYWAKNLTQLSNYQIIFLFYAITSSLIFIQTSSFTALRKAEYSFLQNIVISLRILFIIPLKSFMALGIILSNILSSFIALIISFIALIKLGIKIKNPSLNFLKKSFNFSLGNYLVNLFYLIPPSILPLMILEILGPAEAAYYYISFSISSILFSISASLSTSLFVEGSHGFEVKNKSIKSLLIIFITLLFAYLVILFFGEEILGIIGNSYVNGLELLKTMALSSFLVAVYNIFLAIKRVQKAVKTIVVLSTLNIALILTFSYTFTINYGIVGVGYAWILAYGICSLIIMFLFRDYIRTISFEMINQFLR